MKLQQLRYIWEVAHHDLNVSATAESLFTSQPGISKQIRMLEDELGVQIFARSGKHLTHVTTAGEIILELAGEVLRKAESIKQVAEEFADETRGVLTIASTYADARYMLPAVVDRFLKSYPNVSILLEQDSPSRVANMCSEGKVDLIISTELQRETSGLITIPCYRWNHCLVVPLNHPLAQLNNCSLDSIADYPILTYIADSEARSKLDEAFHGFGLEPNVVFTAVDSDTIKTYVRRQLGVGIIPGLTYQRDLDRDLAKIDISHLISSCITSMAFKRGVFLRSFAYDFVSQFAPHLERGLIQDALSRPHLADRLPLFEDLDLMSY